MVGLSGVLLWLAGGRSVFGKGVMFVVVVVGVGSDHEREMASFVSSSAFLSPSNLSFSPLTRPLPPCYPPFLTANILLFTLFTS